ncbi:MAG TPA: nitroreductase family deazaflavin-dependent oxidoreductase [Thermomicrobiales bacterium]|nr:nitroreductase family deazaflavin-dependent oxidoreductase [Thermomicrobiales bacterium]
MPGPRWLARFNRRATNKLALTHAGWMPGMAIVHHVGRHSGKTYRTPVLLFRDGEEYVIELTYGADSDWVKNVVAAGECEVTSRRQTVHCTDPRIEKVHHHPWAPLFVRGILRLLNVDMVLRLKREDNSVPGG